MAASTAPARLFTDLSPPLLPSTLAALDGLGFSAMTPVQAAAIPLFLGHKDVAAEACTGSGKTVAYVVPIVERLQRLDRALAPASVGAVILAPTRELARQIHDVVCVFARGTALSAALAVGGTKDVAAELRACAARGANVLTATPGRLLDLLNRCDAGGGAGGAPGLLSFRTLEVLVLDEADTLLEMGFADTLTAILARLPKQRRTGLFSATQTNEVRALARAGMRNPVVVTVKVQMPMRKGVGSGGGAGAGAGAGGGDVPPPTRASQSTPASLSNYYTMCADATDKLVQLVGALRQRAARREKAIVFVLTCASVDYYGKVFSSPEVRAACGLPDEEHFPILPLHGRMVPKKRTGNYDAFLAAPCGALLCTDVAARGIDFPDVHWILQLDPPQDPSYYIHRVGRTARAGRRGASLVFLMPAEAAYVQLLGVRSVPIAERAPLPVSSTGVPLDDLAAGAGGGVTAPEGAALVTALQAEALGDRDVLERATRAFVSFVRGYKEHQCRVIFRIDRLDVAALARAFGLIKLPKVDELRGTRVDFAGPQVETWRIGYKEPKREAQRQVRLAAAADAEAAERAARDARRTRALADAAAATAAAAAGGAGGGVAGGAKKRKRVHHGANARMHEDWDALAAEEALEKRLKQGRVTKAQYKRELLALHREQGIEDEEGEGLLALISDDEE